MQTPANAVVADPDVLEDTDPVTDGAEPASDFERDLELAASGDQAARDRFWSEHYTALRQGAKAWFDSNWRRDGRRGDISIGATHIVGAVYERLRDRTAALGKGKDWFFRCFRNECFRVFIEHLRRTKRHKQERADIECDLVHDPRTDVDLNHLAERLLALKRMDPICAHVAMLKIFEVRPDPQRPGAMRGVENLEVAQELRVSLRKVEGCWQLAKRFLTAKLDVDGGLVRSVGRAKQRIAM